MLETKIIEHCIPIGDGFGKQMFEVVYNAAELCRFYKAQRLKEHELHELNELNKMDRDEFARMKARQDIVTAFINKLEKADMSDINLIPALMDYVNTGDRTLFDEYNNFRKVTDTEKKAKEMEERLTEAQANLKSREAEWEKTQRLSNEYRSKINDAIFKYQQWLQEMRETTAKENPQAEFPNMKALRDFAQICIDESPNGYQRKLWLKDGDKLKTVTAILFDGKKAVMEVGEPTTILTPVPKY